MAKKATTRKQRNKKTGKFARCVKAVKKKAWAYDPNAVCAAKERKKARKSNPATGAAAAFERFHGYPSEKVVTVKKDFHYHSHLASLGKLEKLVVKRSSDGKRVSLEGFKGAQLAENEKHTQLFIEGGDQSVNPSMFGVSAPHEIQTLGSVVCIEYFTDKTHLGRSGGKATYVHRITSKDDPPDLIYDTINRKLSFSGGSYRILPEGIDR